MSDRGDAVGMWQRLPVEARDSLLAACVVGVVTAVIPGWGVPQGWLDFLLCVPLLVGFVGALAFRRRYPLGSGLVVAGVALASAVAANAALAHVGLVVTTLTGVSVAYYHRRAWSLPLLVGLAGAWFVAFTLLLGSPPAVPLFTAGPLMAALPVVAGYTLRKWAEHGHMFGVLDEALHQWRRIPVVPRDGILAGLLAALTVGLGPGIDLREPLNALTFVVTLSALVVPLAFRRRYPLGAGLTVAGASLVLAAVDAPAAWFGLWLTTMAGVSAAYHHRERWSLAFLLPAAMVWIACFVALLGGVALDMAMLAVLPLTATVPILIGYAVRLNAERREQHARLRHARILQERSEERARIARDVHDIVGHHLSAIRLQALGGRDSQDPAQAEAALGTVADISGRALGEIRSLLRRLQDEDGEWAGHQEQHRLSDLPELARNLGDVGLRVALDLQATPAHRIAAETHTAGFRIVQEALTNVLRHSTAGSARVRVVLEGSTVSIQVDDPGPPAHQGDDPPSEGRGLVGMRGRAAEVGGELAAGRHGRDGWQVTARLPARQDDQNPVSVDAGPADTQADDGDVDGRLAVARPVVTEGSRGA